MHLGRQIFNLCFLLTNVSVCVSGNLYLVNRIHGSPRDIG